MTPPLFRELALLSVAGTLLGGSFVQSPTFSTVSELVVLHVSVKDRHGAPVANLPQEAFSIIEDHRPQTVSFFASQDAPVTIGLLLDSSGSMQPSRGLVIAAATAFAEASNPRDEFFALSFNDDVTSMLPGASPFTNDPAVLKDVLTRRMVTRGRTALFESLTAGLDYVGRGRNERKVLLLVSDGGDNASRATFDDVFARTQSSNVLVYTVALYDPEDRDRNPRLLKRIAETSGGEAFEPRDAAEIAEVLAHVAHDIRAMYTLGYTSSNPARDGAFRRVNVAVRSTDGKPLVVHSRAGYLASRE